MAGEASSTTSSAQDGLWFQHRLAPGAAHTVSRAYRVTGELNVDALRAAWQAVVDRHDALRTTFVEQDGQPRPRVAGRGTEPAFVDLGTAPPADRDRTADRWCARAADRGPACLAVVRHQPREHVLRLVLHRMVADDGSVAVVLDDLSASYAAAVRGRPPHEALPELRSRYADFVRWQRELPGTPGFGALLDWWTTTLRPLPSGLDLPVDRARPADPSPAAGEVRFEWDGSVLAELATAAATTQRAVLLTGFLALLGRYTGSGRVAVAAVVPVRPGARFDGVVGVFDNLVVLPADLSGRPTFRELAGRVAAGWQAAAAHRELPFETLVRELDAARDPRRTPYCDALFVDRETGGLELPGASTTALPVADPTARADLTLTVDRSGSTVAGTLGYRAALFDPSSAERILGQLHTLLAAARARPDLPVGELEIEPPDRIRAAVRAADLVAAGPAIDRPVPELVHLRARSAPDAPAVSWAGTHLSYADLRRRAALVTAALPAVAGAPVAVRMATGPDQVAALLGVLDAGAQLVCLGRGDAGERGTAVLADARPVCLVLDGDPATDKLARWYAEELGGRVIGVGDLAAGRAPRPAGPRPVPAGLAYLTHTSGSTGQPKGIPQTHATLAQFVTWFGGEFGIGPGSRVAQWAAPGYDAALGEVFAALVAGATLCPVPDRIRANPEKLVDWLATERITVFQTVPSYAKEILRVLGARGTAGLKLDHLLLAGEALPGELADGLRAALPGVRLVNLYGPTESILATWHEITGPVHGTAPIGRSIPGRQVLVVDERDRPCPPGVPGTIVIRGPYITPGYLGAAAADRSGFTPLRAHEELGSVGGPCYRTGDHGRLRWDGALEFRGRGDFQIKFNGVRVELTDIEAALGAHESVAECAVVAARDRHGLVARVMAYVVPARAPSGEPLAAADTWRAVLRRRFGAGMLPVTFTTVLGLPRNIGGKVDRRALPEPAPVTAAAPRPPRTPVELDAAAIWTELLGAEPSGPDHSFFTAGGHSLLALRLLSRVHERFGVDVPLLSFLADPTLSGLSALVESHVDSRKPQNNTMTG